MNRVNYSVITYYTTENYYELSRNRNVQNLGVSVSTPNLVEIWNNRPIIKAATADSNTYSFTYTHKVTSSYHLADLSKLVTSVIQINNRNKK